MPLHLLGKKSWNVYNSDNIARVRRDEAEAEERERERERRMQAVDAERRIALLRESQCNDRDSSSPQHGTDRAEVPHAIVADTPGSLRNTPPLPHAQDDRSGHHLRKRRRTDDGHGPHGVPEHSLRRTSAMPDSEQRPDAQVAVISGNQSNVSLRDAEDLAWSRSKSRTGEMSSSSNTNVDAKRRRTSEQHPTGLPPSSTPVPSRGGALHAPPKPWYLITATDQERDSRSQGSRQSDHDRASQKENNQHRDRARVSASAPSAGRGGTSSNSNDPFAVMQRAQAQLKHVERQRERGETRHREKSKRRHRHRERKSEHR